MLKLRKFLCGCFGFLALGFAVASPLAISVILDSIHRDGLLPPIQNVQIPSILAIGLGVLARLVLAIPLALTVVFGVAWWKVRKGRSGARGWAIAASLSTVLASLLVFLTLD